MNCTVVRTARAIVKQAYLCVNLIIPIHICGICHISHYFMAFKTLEKSTQNIYALIVQGFILRNIAVLNE